MTSPGPVLPVSARHGAGRVPLLGVLARKDDQP